MKPLIHNRHRPTLRSFHCLSTSILLSNPSPITTTDNTDNTIRTSSPSIRKRTNPNRCIYRHTTLLPLILLRCVHTVVSYQLVDTMPGPHRFLPACVWQRESLPIDRARHASWSTEKAVVTGRQASEIIVIFVLFRKRYDAANE